MHIVIAQNPDGERTLEFCVINCFPYVKIARQAWSLQTSASLDLRFSPTTAMKFLKLAEKLSTRIDEAPDYVIDVSQCNAAVRKGVTEFLTGKGLTGRPESIAQQKVALAKASLAS